MRGDGRGEVFGEQVVAGVAVRDFHNIPGLAERLDIRQQQDFCRHDGTDSSLGLGEQAHVTGAPHALLDLPLLGKIGRAHV